MLNVKKFDRDMARNIFGNMIKLAEQQALANEVQNQPQAQKEIDSANIIAQG